MSRSINVEVGGTMSFHSSLHVRARHSKGGWFVRTKTGDDYTRDLEAWGKRELMIDNEHDRYREVIDLYDGARLESNARLRDHPG